MLTQEQIDKDLSFRAYMSLQLYVSELNDKEYSTHETRVEMWAQHRQEILSEVLWLS